MEVPFPPGARNEKAPARSLSGRTSAMIEICIKGGRFVKDVFFFLYKGVNEFSSRCFLAMTSGATARRVYDDLSVTN